MYSKLHCFTHFLIALTLCMAGALAALAQTPAATASLRGHIADQTGALIPGAQVTLATSAGTAVTTATADASGHIPDQGPGARQLHCAGHLRGLRAFCFADHSARGRPGRCASIFPWSMEAEQQNVHGHQTSRPRSAWRPAATPIPSSSRARIWTRCRTIRMSCRTNCRRWLAPRPDPTAGRFTLTVSPADNCRPSRRSAKFASTRIPFRPSSTGWATGASRFSPSPAPTSCTGISSPGQRQEFQHRQSIYPQYPRLSQLSVQWHRQRIALEESVFLYQRRAAQQAERRRLHGRDSATISFETRRSAQSPHTHQRLPAHRPAVRRQKTP